MSRIGKHGEIEELMISCSWVEVVVEWVETDLQIVCKVSLWDNKSIVKWDTGNVYTDI